MQRVVAVARTHAADAAQLDLQDRRLHFSGTLRVTERTFCENCGGKCFSNVKLSLGRNPRSYILYSENARPCFHSDDVFLKWDMELGKFDVIFCGVEWSLAIGRLFAHELLPAKHNLLIAQEFQNIADFRYLRGRHEQLHF